METNLKQPVNNEVLKQVAEDVAFIKSILILNQENELTDWAKNELAEARAESKDSYISLDNLKREIENA